MMAGLGVIAFDFFFTAFPQSAETLTARVFRNRRFDLGLRVSERSHHRVSDRHAEGSSRNAVSPAPLNVGEQISAGTSPGVNLETGDSSLTLREAVVVDQIIPRPSMLSGPLSDMGGSSVVLAGSNLSEAAVSVDRLPDLTPVEIVKRSRVKKMPSIARNLKSLQDSDFT